jgi:hypothetical protein
MPRAKLAGRVFDCSQNDPGKQTVAPTLASDTCAACIRIARVERARRAVRIQPQAALARVAKHGDLFAEVLTLRQSL